MEALVFSESAAIQGNGGYRESASPLRPDEAALPPPPQHPAMPLVLRHFRACRSGTVAMYSLQMADADGECWAITRRYSEFLQCHVQLLEVFGRKELPRFPPKEPALQKFFGGSDARSTWAEERMVMLHDYVSLLLEQPKYASTRPLFKLLGVPMNEGFDASQARGLSKPIDGLLISGVRVRLSGDPGRVEVVVRAVRPRFADTAANRARILRVRLALRPLADPASESYAEEESPTSPPSRLDGQERLAELQLPDGEGFCEASQEFQLDPGSLWEVDAVALGVLGDPEGNYVTVQLRAPTADEMIALPERCRSAAGATDCGLDVGIPASEAPGPHAEAHNRALEEDSYGVDSTGNCMSSLPALRPQFRRVATTEIHDTISYQGRAAAAYAKKIEQMQRRSMELAPNRFERDDQGYRSVAVKLSVVASNDTDVASPRERQLSVEELDENRQNRQLVELQEEECEAALWIHAVTGDPGIEAAVAGERSLQAALQSGEALCDLVNAIWPGTIVGIHRGDASHFLQLANICLFVRACGNLGVDSHCLFSGNDLLEGKSMKNVVRCIQALAMLVPRSASFSETPRGTPNATPERRPQTDPRHV